MYDKWKDIKDQLEARPNRLGKVVTDRLRNRAKEIVEWFNARRAHCADRLFHNLPETHAISSDNIWKPDMLHTLYEGMAKYLFEWLESFLKEEKRLHRFNELWIAIPRSDYIFLHYIPTFTDPILLKI